MSRKLYSQLPYLLCFNRIWKCSATTGNIFMFTSPILKINRNRLSLFEEKHCHKQPQKDDCSLLSRSLKKNLEVCMNGDNRHIC